MKGSAMLHTGLLVIAALALIAALGALLADRFRGASAVAIVAAVLVAGLAMFVRREFARVREPARGAHDPSGSEPGATAEALARFDEASRQKDEFLAVVAHEMRDPLSPILMWTQLLRSGTLDEIGRAHV